MYFCITTTPFREWHNRRPPFFRRKAEPKNLKQKELSFKLRMKSCPAGITPGRLYYTEKNQYVNTASAAASGNLRRKIANIRIRCCFFEKVS